MNDLIRLFNSYEVLDGGCWQWTRSLNWAGYGTFTLHGVRHPAHRAAYLMLVGPVPRTFDLDHLCRNRACVNPSHLEPVTRATNLKRGDVGQWARRKTHCARAGHPLAGDNLYICPRGGRECRACRAEANFRHRTKQRTST